MRTQYALPVAFAPVAGAGAAPAQAIPPGFTFAVASGNACGTGTHYHSDTGGAFGNPAGKAEVGNDLEDVDDFHAASIGTVGSFSTAALSAGDVLSFDTASIFDSAVAGGASSLGIRLQRAGQSSESEGAWTFDTFRLTSDDRTTSVAPEPSSYALLTTGLGALGALGAPGALGALGVVLRRRRRGPEAAT